MEPSHGGQCSLCLPRFQVCDYTDVETTTTSEWRPRLDYQRCIGQRLGGRRNDTCVLIGGIIMICVFQADRFRVQHLTLLRRGP